MRGPDTMRHLSLRVMSRWLLHRRRSFREAGLSCHLIELRMWHRNRLIRTIVAVMPKTYAELQMVGKAPFLGKNLPSLLPISQWLVGAVLMRLMIADQPREESCDPGGIQFQIEKKIFVLAVNFDLLVPTKLIVEHCSSEQAPIHRHIAEINFLVRCGQRLEREVVNGDGYESAEFLQGNQELFPPPEKAMVFTGSCRANIDEPSAEEAETPRLLHDVERGFKLCGIGEDEIVIRQQDVWRADLLYGAVASEAKSAIRRQPQHSDSVVAVEACSLLRRSVLIRSDHRDVGIARSDRADEPSGHFVPRIRDENYGDVCRGDHDLAPHKTVRQVHFRPVTFDNGSRLDQSARLYEVVNGFHHTRSRTAGSQLKAMVSDEYSGREAHSFRSGVMQS